MEIKIENVNYSYKDKEILKNINVDFVKGKVNAIIGPTGAGKSTLAMMLNGLLSLSDGNIYYDNLIVNKKSRRNKINKERFNVGLVFQYPEEQFFCETVFKEIAFGLKINKVDSNSIKESVSNVIKMVGLSDDILNRDPFTLSSGEKRKVAIASILVLEPNVLILDEPTVGLDNYSRFNLIKIIKKINKKEKKTIIVISHDTDFINEVADYVVLMNKGEIVTNGKKYDILSDERLLSKNGIKVPNIIKFENYVLKKKNIRLGYRSDVNDLIKDILRNV